MNPSDHTNEQPAVRRTYHHGNLSEALINAARDILEQEGLEALSLRAVARKAGVSHNAPYHHFPSKADLVAEVARLGFLDMVNRAKEAIDQINTDDHFGRIDGLGKSYLTFAIEQPALFQIMFQPQWTQEERFHNLKAARIEAFQFLINAVTEAKEDGAITVPDPRKASLMAWWSLHGYCVLHNAGALRRNQQVLVSGADMSDLAICALRQALGMPNQHQS